MMKTLGGPWPVGGMAVWVLVRLTPSHRSGSGAAITWNGVLARQNPIQGVAAAP